MICAVIVTYNGERWIEAAVKSLGASESVSHILVVDNCSSDSTRKKLADLPKTLLIAKSRNIGFGRANNEGIGEALRRGADSILLLNQDARISPDNLAILEDALIRNPEYGIVSPVHLSYNGTNIDPYFISYMATEPAIISDIYHRRTKTIYEVPFVNAAAWLVSRRVFEKAGGFDPLFFLYGEDSDYCRRIRHHGFKLGIVPSATVHHEHMVKDKTTLSLQNRINWQYSGLICNLKMPKRGFFRNFAGIISECTREGVQAILVRDMKGCIATMLAATKCFAKLATIRRHYVQSKMEGPHWLDWPSSRPGLKDT
jgi:GT2 family glycosyltransferase